MKTTKLNEVCKAVEPFKTLLEVTEDANYIIVHPLNYIEPATFSEIGRAMRTFNAEYTKKPTTWRILKAEANPKLSLAVNHIQKAQELMMQALDELKQAGY